MVYYHSTGEILTQRKIKMEKLETAVKKLTDRQQVELICLLEFLRTRETGRTGEPPPADPQEDRSAEK